MEIFKKNLKLEIIVSALFAVTVCLFGPLEIVLSQSIEFWFSVSDVLPIILITTLLLFIIINIIFFLTSKINEIVLRISVSIVAALGFCAYIQGNWTFVNYGSMDGTPIDWSNYTTWSVVDAVLWIVIIIAVLYIINFKKKFDFICKYLFLGVLGIQMITLGTLTINHIGSDTTVDFTLEGIEEFELSSNKENILVICADGFDAGDFLPVLEEEQCFREYFDGFTFYEDTCGTSLYSEESGITLLTGNQFDVGSTFAQNVKTAYKNTDLYKTLEDYNYNTYIYCEEKMVSPTIGDQIINYKSARSGIGSTKDTFNSIYKMVAFRYMPHFLKKNFWYSTMDFSTLQDGEARLYYNYNVYRYLENHGIRAAETEKNIYQFFWIQGPHEPANTDRNCRKVDTVIQMDNDEYADRQFEQTIGVVKLFTKIIESLKESGIYDNTTVIFTADHGWDVRPNPLLLIKPANSRGNLVLSETPVSIMEDYLPTLKYYITGNDTGDTIYSVENIKERERKIYVYDINVTDRTYNARNTEFYPAGMFLNLNRWGLGEYQPSQIKTLSVDGFSRVEFSEKTESFFIWTNGHEAELKINLENESYNNIRCELNYTTYNGQQPIEIYANDLLIARFIANGQEKHSFIIPGEIITNGKLFLKLHLPNAVAPCNINPDSNDERMLALMFSSIGFYDTDEEVSEDQIKKYKINSEINFTAGNNTASDYCVSGFSHSEDTATWTNDYEAKMNFILDNYKNTDLTLSMNYATYNKQQTVTVYANDIKLESYTAYDEETKVITIPADCVKGDVLNLKFELPDAKSPLELGHSEDGRKLSLYFKSMKISDTPLYENHKYTFGDEIDFTEGGNSEKYIQNGFSHQESAFTWSSGYSGKMRFLVDEEENYDSCKLIIGIARVFNDTPRQMIISTANGIIYDDELAGAAQLQIPLKKEDFNNGVLELSFEWPDAQSPSELLGTSDSRLLSVAFVNMSLLLE